VTVNDGTDAGNLFTLQANFVKISIKFATSLLVLDMRTGTFLFPEKALGV